MEMKKTIRKLAKNARAVSPVIATLMLVLVAVGSAGVFYVWQSGWQETTTDSIEDTDMRATLKIGGSSTVYPVSILAAEAFMVDHPQYNIEVQKGGSDSGIIGAGEGILDIGAASKAMDDDYKAKYPNAVETIIGYDGVVVVVPDGNSHGLVSIDRDILAQIYDLNSGMDKLASHPLDEDSDLTIQWNEVPKTALPKASTLDVTAATGQTADPQLDDGNYWIDYADGAAPEGLTYVTVSGGSGVIEIGGPADDQSDVDHWDVCTGTVDVQVYDRAEHSGTEECFCKKILAKLLGSELTMSEDTGHSATSNQELVTSISDDVDALGFMSFGLAGAESGKTSDLEQIPFSPSGVTDDPGLPTYEDIATSTWVGSRPLVYITDGEPSGIADLFINYVLLSQNNQDFCGATSYVSIYK